MLKRIEIDRLKNVETAVILALALLLVSYKYQDIRIAVTASIVLILGLIIPVLFYPLAKLWFGLGLLLGFITTKILLTVIFFLLVTPVGLIRRLLGHDALGLKKFKSDETSTFVIRNHNYTSEDLKTPF